ncbi:MAG: hypothetical protein Q8R37_00610 [Nanoarchaeota archaeon]|nr:hypothetical protein [Nanoarchaeota archaeon]
MAINQLYLNNSRQITTSFSEDFPGAILFDFFDESYFRRWQRTLHSVNYTKEKKHLTHSYAKAVTTLPDTLELRKFIVAITRKKMKRLSAEIIQFGWKDYTILNDTVNEKHHYDFIIDLDDFWDERSGGTIFYSDGTGNYVHIPARRNTITIVKRTKNLRQFVKYVNHRAGRKKRHLLFIRI